MSLTRLLFLAPALLLLNSCGGGGGGSDFVGAAIVRLNVSPGAIDTGDRTEIIADISEVNKNGIILKFRYPAGLNYVPSTAFLSIDGRDIDLTPNINTFVNDDQVTYLAFFLSQEEFAEPGSDYHGETGTVHFELEGTEPISNGKIEVDPDVNDPAEDDSGEFNVANPQFAAEEEESIEVSG